MSWKVVKLVSIYCIKCSSPKTPPPPAPLVLLSTAYADSDTAIIQAPVTASLRKHFTKTEQEQEGGEPEGQWGRGKLKETSVRSRSYRTKN
jgi:hypothetical protein